jgi:predicted enzyme related to lactoylglutathione lyase
MITSANVSDLPGWLDLGSPDPSASAEFYRQVFGWTSTPAGDGTMEYFMLAKDGKIVAGLGGLQDPAAKPDWTIYVRVADAAAVIPKAEAAGAKVRVPYMEVPEEGGFAQLTDPSGAEFALWQPGRTIGFELCCENDSLLWVELYTRDPQAAKDFYGTVFGWQTVPYTMPEGSYDMWTTDASDESGRAAFGGIMQIAEGLPIQDEKWVPYFMVADTDATVARTVDAGGTVLIPATDAPPGRLAALTDQFGARFNLLKPDPRM